VSDDQTMREALDVLVTTGRAVAVVTATDGRRRGVLTLERISKELAS
jgi:predicted transcriptional regulator